MIDISQKNLTYNALGLMTQLRGIKLKKGEKSKYHELSVVYIGN